MGVRLGDEALRREVDGVLARRAVEIRALLESYAVPVVGEVSRAPR